MRGLFLDDKGKEWPEESPGLASRLPLREPDRLGHAVGELGWVYINKGDDWLILSFCPRRISVLARTAAYLRINRDRPSLVHLVCVTETDHWRESVPAEAAASRIEEIVRDEELIEPRGLISARMRLDALREWTDPGVGLIYEVWQQSGGIWRPEVEDILNRRRLLDRALVVRLPPRSDRTVIQHWGRRRDLFGEEWARSAKGRDLREQPYPGLALKLTEVIRNTIAEARPRLDAVRIAIRTPQGRIRRRQFQRLVLPWQSPGGPAAYALVINTYRRPTKWTRDEPETVSELLD